MSASAAKADLRVQLLGWRRGLSPAEIGAWSESLTGHLLAWAGLAAARRVMVYAALAREPQTAGLVAALRTRGVTLALPEVDGVELRPLVVADMPAGSAGGGPAAGALAGEGQILPAAELDAVLVPGLAFDPSGRRLGRGGGHYDRFLRRVRPDCLRIGMCFLGQVVPEVPTDPWDEPVDVMATEVGVREGESRRATRP